MCTLTYLPTGKGFLLTSNRDESIKRKRAVFPSFSTSQSGKLLMPLDPQGGGTWILVAENGSAACLLNGAFENHQRKLSYRKSRGRVIVESFDYQHIDDFISAYNFENIEPFTLIKVIQAGGEKEIHEIRWNGFQLSHKLTDSSQPHLWSSVTLYDEQMRAKRDQWFAAWLANRKDFTSEDIRDFHLHGGEGSPSVDFNMARSGGLQTISLASIMIDSAYAQVAYMNLITQQESVETLILKSTAGETKD